MLQNPDIGLLGTALKYVDKNKNITDPPEMFNITTHEQIRKKIVEYNPYCHSSIITKFNNKQNQWL